MSAASIRPTFRCAMSHWQSSWGSSGRSWRGSGSESWSQWRGSGSGSDWRSNTGQQQQGRWVTVSAASASDDPGLYYNDVDMEDMTPLEREEAGMAPTTTWGKLPRRTEKLGKAFQNWRRVQMKFLAEMQYKKILFMSWKGVAQWRLGLDGQGENKVCMQDLLWREDDMDHFLHTVASFQTHKRLWKAQRAERRFRSHIHYNKPMPRMIPPSYVRLFQIILSQTHSSKFWSHFGGPLMAPLTHPSSCFGASQVLRWLNQPPWRRTSSAGFSRRTPGWPSIPRPPSWITIRPRT